ncbi:MAG: hypothetical protein COT74_00540 [Bdellovibrionales bacterium CG10_big_fil_rev_8_21_14_0_10_45_34]|nr:MAG: hypothetical protein COT74_00540 [Bdellovibrionales bacterium CG10_big_fil_rev_8_21_14_0_10_45_34]
MNNKTLLVAAALAGLVATSGCSSTQKNQGEVAMGECHGINSCKAQGECGGAGHSCAGKNSCKGQGWVKLSKSDCSQKGGTFKGSMM